MFERKEKGTKRPDLLKASEHKQKNRHFGRTDLKKCTKKWSTALSAEWKKWEWTQKGTSRTQLDKKKARKAQQAPVECFGRQQYALSLNADQVATVAPTRKQKSSDQGRHCARKTATAATVSKEKNETVAKVDSTQWIQLNLLSPDTWNKRKEQQNTHTV